MDDVREVVVKRFVVRGSMGQLILVLTGGINTSLLLVERMIADWLVINVNREIRIGSSSSVVCVLGLYLRDGGQDGVVELVMRYSGQQLIGAHRIWVGRRGRFTNSEWYASWVIRKRVTVIMDGIMFGDLVYMGEGG